MPNPYITSFQQSQDVSGLQPIYQNMAAQQQFQNQAAMQGQQLAQQAGQTAGGGMNPMAMAAMLRKKDPNAPQGNSLMDRASAYLNTQQSPEMQAEINKLGSNTWNPMSDYNMGTNGWGSYGE
jgi:hypothetical protein